jgi:hypothetical protein
MRYVVTVGHQTLELDRDGDEIRVDGAKVTATITDVAGTPVRMIGIGSEVHRVVARRGQTRVAVRPGPPDPCRSSRQCRG